MNTPYVSIRKAVLEKLEAHLPELQDRFGIETIGIFGSVSRGEDTPDSDVDVLYLFKPGRGGMYDMSALKDHLEELFGRDVDLISAKYISPAIRKYVAEDAICYGGKTAGVGLTDPKTRTSPTVPLSLTLSMSVKRSSA